MIYKINRDIYKLTPDIYVNKKQNSWIQDKQHLHLLSYNGIIELKTLKINRCHHRSPVPSRIRNLTLVAARTLFFHSHLKILVLVNRCMHFIYTSWTLNTENDWKKTKFFVFRRSTRTRGSSTRKTTDMTG